MRIGVQTEHFDPRRGGAETYAFHLVRHLLAESHDVHLFTSGVSVPTARERVHVVRPFHPTAIRSAIRRAGLDVVIGFGKGLGMHVFQPHGGTVIGTIRQNIALIARSGMRRIVSALNQVNPKYLKAVRLERRQFAQQDPEPQFIALSRMVREDMRTLYNVPDDRLHLVYNGVDVDAFSPGRCSNLRSEARRVWGLAPATTCFLLVAHNFRLKGLRELIDAASRMSRRHDNFRVVVVGKDSAGRFARRSRRLGCRDLIRFVGPMRETQAAYAAADVYVHPTWYDPCSLTVLEAWACGRPVITTRLNGAGELMTDGMEGFLIDTPAHVETLAARMTDLLDRELRSQMGCLARSLAERNTSTANFVRIREILELAATAADSRI